MKRAGHRRRAVARYCVCTVALGTIGRGLSCEAFVSSALSDSRLGTRTSSPTRTSASSCTRPVMKTKYGSQWQLHSASTLTPPLPPAMPASTTASPSTAAQWHRDRRQTMLAEYGDQIAPLERSAHSQAVGGLLLAAGNLLLAGLSIVCGRLADWKWTLALAAFPGSILSLWQLQILHDNLHGCLLDKSKQFFLSSSTSSTTSRLRIPKKKLQQAILFWGSMPSIFGYYLYLQYGHLTHHQAVGNPAKANLRTLFDSPQPHFEDGDVLFVAHRMKLLGGPESIGPRFVVKGKEIVLSIANLGFRQWNHIDKEPTTKMDGTATKRPTVLPTAIWNMSMFALSFLFERMLLVVNDGVVAVTGTNFFFLNKPKQFHRECAQYCRAACLVRAALWWCGGKSWHSLLFLYLAETLWSIPPHPAAAMFVTNHGSRPNTNLEEELGGPLIAASPPEACLPSSSTYAGKWYSILTLGTNYHCEHHDFPNIPFHRLGELRQIAPEFYRSTTHKKDNLWRTMQKAFARPDYYACMNDMESIR